MTSGTTHMTDVNIFTDIALYLFVVAIPILFIYISYLLAKNAFNDMGFTTIEAIIILLVCLLFGSGIMDNITTISFSSIPFTTYGNWTIAINTGGALIPIILSIYLVVRRRIDLKNLAIGILLVTVATYIVTTPDPAHGIIAIFPYWLLPIIIASATSIILYRNKPINAAPFAYIIGTMGVLIGADVLHLYQLISIQIPTPQIATIGGANVFDMVFITGLLAVVIDSILISKERVKQMKG